MSITGEKYYNAMKSKKASHKRCLEHLMLKNYRNANRNVAKRINQFKYFFHLKLSTQNRWENNKHFSFKCVGSVFPKSNNLFTRRVFPSRSDNNTRYSRLSDVRLIRAIRIRFRYFSAGLEITLG